MVYDRDTANGMLGVAHRTSRRRKLRGCLKKSQLEPGQQQRLGQQQTCGHCSALPCSASQHDPSSCSCVSHLHNDDDRIIQSSTSSRRRLSGSEENVSCSSSSLYKRKKVSFDLLHIAIFPIQLGDNPAVSAGVPIQLSWEAEYEIECELDMYEHSRPVERRSLKQLSLSVPTRARIALQAGHSLTEIALATLEVDNIKLSRYKSMQDGSSTSSQTMINSTKNHPQQPKWMRAITTATSLPSATTNWNNQFAILRERTTRALRTLTQSQPRTAWAKTA